MAPPFGAAAERRALQKRLDAAEERKSMWDKVKLQQLLLAMTGMAGERPAEPGPFSNQPDDEQHCQ